VPLDVWGLVAALVVVALVVLLTGHSATGNKPSAAGPPLGARLSPDQIKGKAVQPTRRPATTARKPVEGRAPRPVRIRIKAIGVSAPIIRLGLNKDRTIQVPSNYSDTGWYAPGPEPGERGAAVIVGHVDSKTGPAVFYKLGGLRRGDTISIGRADGSVIRFKVQGTERWPKSSFPTKRVYTRTKAATLRLITCSGAFDSGSGHYADNTIVYAVRL
jgi:sortase (surface protein transpeptidase)